MEKYTKTTEENTFSKLGQIQMIRDKKRKLLSALALSMWIGRQINDERNISDIRTKVKECRWQTGIKAVEKMHVRTWLTEPTANYDNTTERHETDRQPLPLPYIVEDLQQEKTLIL